MPRKEQWRLSAAVEYTSDVIIMRFQHGPLNILFEVL